MQGAVNQGFKLGCQFAHGMNSLFDISATTPLSGLHMKGTVTRRFLITYGVSPAVVANAVPPGAELSLFNGMAWISACYVNLSGMRLSFAPEWTGAGFNYLIHRTRARLPYPDGKLRESVLVLEASIDRPFLGFLAGQTAGVRFKARDIELLEAGDSWTLRMASGEEVLFQAQIYKDSFGKEIRTSSKFPSAQQADQFLLGVSFGGEWQPSRGRLRLLAETHDPWQTLVGRCTTSRHAYLESLGAVNVEADHVITMTDIPHYFALLGTSVPTFQPEPAKLPANSSNDFSVPAS